MNLLPSKSARAVAPPFAAVIVLLSAGAGCSRGESWKAKYTQLFKAASEAYYSSDAEKAYRCMVALTSYTGSFEKKGLHVNNYNEVQALEYARLALLAEHLGRISESHDDWTTAVRYARNVHVEIQGYGPFPTNEPAFRKWLAATEPASMAKWKQDQAAAPR